MTDGYHASMPWDAPHSREVETEQRDTKNAISEFCRQRGSRMNFILTLIEKGLDAQTVRVRLNIISKQRGWEPMPAHEADSVYRVGKRILTGTLSVPEDEQTPMVNGRIAWKRAQRVVRVVHMRAEGRSWAEIVDALDSTQNIVQNDYYQFMNRQIAGVYHDHGTIPWDEWLEKHGASALKGLRKTCVR